MNVARDPRPSPPILVVDDAAENVRILIRILERGGYTDVTGLTDPRAVLQVVKELAPLLVILDVHMPEKDGYEVMDEVRSMVPHVPKFLLVTGDAVGTALSEAQRRGADDLLTKPFQIADVLDRAGRLLTTEISPPE